MVIEKVIAIDDEILEKLEEVLKKENAKKPKGEKLTIRMLPEEIALYQHYIELTEYKNISDLVRKAVREKIKKIIIPNNPVEQRFLRTWGIHRKIGKAIEKHVSEIENEIDKIVEKIDESNIDDELLIDFIQKQQVSSAIAISLLRKKLERK
jgi:Arc/MetJ-type ribon-helix-helix transcriptional regulator